jgi:hypothetical protein
MSGEQLSIATRRAAFVGVVAVLAFACLWTLTTQVKAIRAYSPFADDPWDAFATYAAIFLPFAALPTWIRGLRHREQVLARVTARRILWGSGLAAAIIAIASAADAIAIAMMGWPRDTGAIAIVVNSLVVVVLSVALAALALTARGAMALDRTAEAPARTLEPDLIDDLLGLATEVARPLGLGRPIERVSNAIQQFLDRSKVSPRRHRIAFGVVLALAAAVVFDAWQTVVEGPWASLVVPVVFGVLISSAVFAIYLGTLGPLRLLRPPRG